MYNWHLSLTIQCSYPYIRVSYWHVYCFTGTILTLLGGTREQTSVDTFHRNTHVIFVVQGKQSFTDAFVFSRTWVCFIGWRGGDPLNALVVYFFLVKNLKFRRYGVANYSCVFFLFFFNRRMRARCGLNCNSSSGRKIILFENILPRVDWKVGLVRRCKLCLTGHGNRIFRRWNNI